jgi:hypothetical protein
MGSSASDYFTDFSFIFLLISAALFFYLMFKFWYHGKYDEEKQEAECITQECTTQRDWSHQMRLALNR